MCKYRLKPIFTQKKGYIFMIMPSAIANTWSFLVGLRVNDPVNSSKAGSINWLWLLKKQRSLRDCLPLPRILTAGWICPQKLKKLSRSSGWWVNRKSFATSSSRILIPKASNLVGQTSFPQCYKVAPLSLNSPMHFAKFEG